MVESCEYPGTELEGKIRTYLEGFWTEFLENLTETQFHDFREGMLSSKKTDFISVKKEGKYMFNWIMAQSIHFDSLDIQIAFIETITLAKFKEFYLTHFSPDSHIWEAVYLINSVNTPTPEAEAGEGESSSDSDMSIEEFYTDDQDALTRWFLEEDNHEVWESLGLTKFDYWQHVSD